MHIVEADCAFVHIKRFGAWLVLHFLLYIEKVEHLLNVSQALTDFTIDETDEIERNGKLHQHRVDEYEVTKRLRTHLHFARRHHHDNGHTDTENHSLTKVQPAERSPGFGRGIFIARHRRIEALGFHRLIAEIFDRLEVE